MPSYPSWPACSTSYACAMTESANCHTVNISRCFTAPLQPTAAINQSTCNSFGVLTVTQFTLLFCFYQLPVSQRGVSKFHALRPPAISIKDYLQRVAKYAACSGECFVLALVYIDRIIQSNPTFVVNSLNIHRLLITSIMLAAKFFDDQYFNNAYYAKVGGVPCSEINSLEVEFLFLCNFALFVNTETYSQYYTELCNHAANVGNVCACSQGPRVPVLMIPQYAQLSQPPPQLDGYVLYPVRGGDEEAGKAEDEEGEMMEAAGGMGMVQGVRGSVDGMQHTQQPHPHYAQAGMPVHHNQHGGYYYHPTDQQGNPYAAYPPMQPAVHQPPVQSVPQAGQVGYYGQPVPHGTHGMSRPDARPGAGGSSGDTMISSPQVGVV